MKGLNENRAIVKTLYEKYGAVIYDLCVRVMKDRSEAEDALQETFVQAYRSVDSVRNKDAYLSWLYRVAYRACLKLIRKKRRIDLRLVEEPESMAKDAASGAQETMQAKRAVLKLMERLDERNQEIVVAHFIAGIDQGTIAESLGISRRAVVKRITAIRAMAGDLAEEI